MQNEETRPFAQASDTLNDDLQHQSEKGQRRDLIITRVIYGVVAFIVVSVIVAVIIVLVTSYQHSSKSKQRFILDTMFNSSFSVRSFRPVWKSDGTGYVWWAPTNTSNECDLRSADLPDRQESIIISTQELKENKISCNSDFLLSYDSRYVAIKSNVEKVFRHSTRGNYVVYDTFSKTFAPVSPRASEKQKTLIWCPGNANLAAYVENNNIFLKNFDLPDLQSNIQVTTDGDIETIFNGVTDWLYEEEVFTTVDTLTFSPDCSMLAFLKLNDTNVPIYQWEEYAQTDPLPKTFKIRVSVPGSPNPIPTVHVYNVAQALTSQLDIGSNSDIYIYDLQWANDSTVASTRVNRLQNTKELLISVVPSNLTDISLIPIADTVLIQQTEQWIQYARSAMFIPNTNGRYFVDIIPNPDNYNLGLFDLQRPGANKLDKLLVSGLFDVLDIYQTYNAPNSEIFIASAEQGSTSRHIYAVQWTTGARRCISDKTYKIQSVNQGAGFTDASFAPTLAGGIAILYINGPDLPVTQLISINSVTTDGITDPIFTLENNTALRITRALYDMPSSKLSTVKSADGVTDLNMLTVYPPFFSEGVQYPVLMYLYAGPGSQMVSSAYSALNRAFSLYVASLGFIVVTVDGRGTGARGHRFLTQTYKRLGQLETEDQIAVANNLKSQWQYVKRDGFAIWGWSYGGYMTLNVISSAANKNVFALGMSVAPVTDWRFYDSAYTERYMQLPTLESNLEGYQNTSILNRVSNEKKNDMCYLNSLNLGTGKTSLLLVHGTGDDNVRPLNSFNLITRLQTCGVQFDVMFYPNKDHSIPGLATQKHLYRTLSNKLQLTLTQRVVNEVEAATA